MSVHQLTSGNFQVVGRNRKTLNITAPGTVLLFFKMDGCTGCNAFEPIFYQLAQQQKNINYAIANLTASRDVIAMSRSTSTPITAVPFLILYVNGSPLAKYTGKKNIPALRSFVGKALQHANSQRSQSNSFMPSSQPTSYGGNYNQAQANQGGYGQQQQSNKIWAPEMGKTPSIQGIVTRDGTSQYGYDIEEEDEEKLELPGEVTPHNVPWESANRR